MIFIEKCILYFTYKNNYGNDKVYCIQFAYFSYEYNRYYAGAYCILYISTYAGTYCVLFKWGHAEVYCLLYIYIYMIFIANAFVLFFFGYAGVICLLHVWVSYECIIQVKLCHTRVFCTLYVRMIFI